MKESSSTGANGQNKITVQFETGGDTWLTGSDYQRVNHGRDAADNTSHSVGSSASYINIQSTNDVDFQLFNHLF